MHRQAQLLSSRHSHEIAHQTAFHEAGHVVSIYLGNKEKQLPPVFFQIKLTRESNQSDILKAQVIDGQLIQGLPVVVLDNLADLSDSEKHSYQCAYEADVINLLAGPLAEARYISIRDDEVLNMNLLTTHSLEQYYGGQSDIQKAYAYLEYFIADPRRREITMLELFVQAWQFIQEQKNWTCILNLAHYILDSDKDCITSEDAIKIIDHCIT